MLSFVLRLEAFSHVFNHFVSDLLVLIFVGLALILAFFRALEMITLTGETTLTVLTFVYTSMSLCFDRTSLTWLFLIVFNPMQPYSQIFGWVANVTELLQDKFYLLRQLTGTGGSSELDGFYKSTLELLV